ncbi:MAG: glucose-6-phosphate isomerase [Gammaproteobacteria bacterium]|nr:glucose-6-phosphate isomerase [Gammaproteobacteria bacterium]
MSASHSKRPQDLGAWQRLAGLAKPRTGKPVTGRATARSRRLGPIFIDFSKQALDDEVAEALTVLASESNLASAIDGMFSGARINSTEGRPVQHTLLRAPSETCPEEVATERERFLALADAVRSGQRRGYTGKPFEIVVVIGIGGSQLGPELVVDALRPPHAPEVRFLANIDGDAAVRALAGLDPATTLVIFVSKSFTTLEARVNAQTVRSWFLERTVQPRVVEEHFLAVTANQAAAREFGIAPDNRFAMWDWVGGRFSLWSAAGLPIAIALGRGGFEDLLAGAHMVDDHFRETPLGDNIPVLLALIAIWNTNFHGAATHAVLPYDRRLRLLAGYLQQLEMESNGKSVRRDGHGVGTHTAPVVWGGEETNGQHAFHQLLLQGTRAFSADFIAVVRAGHALDGHHEWLLANCLAQSKAMLEGRVADGPLAEHRSVPGGHPSTTLLLDELSPRSLGALLALYEHKVFCLGAIWQINAFDQWGVELGKELAGPIHEELATGEVRGTPHDASTAGLLTQIRRAR